MAVFRHVQQLVVRYAAPQEKRKARCQFQVAQTVNAARRQIMRIALDMKKKLRIEQQSFKRRSDSRFEVAFASRFLIKARQNGNVVIRYRTPIGSMCKSR